MSCNFKLISITFLLQVIGDLSDKEHYQDEGHNRDYDHEAFLGDDAPTFDQLTPEESKKRLGYVRRIYCKFNLDEISRNH